MYFEFEQKSYLSVWEGQRVRGVLSFVISRLKTKDEIEEAKIYTTENEGSTFWWCELASALGIFQEYKLEDEEVDDAEEEDVDSHFHMYFKTVDLSHDETLEFDLLLSENSSLTKYLKK